MGKYNLSYICSKCFKDFDEGQHPGYFIPFNKCLGKTCPDCGRVRKLERVRCFYENLSRPGSEGKSFFGCVGCGKMAEYFFNGVCGDCFCKVQKEKNSCVCPFETTKDKLCYCSFCEEFHSPLHWTLCKKCAKKQDNKSVGWSKKEIFYRIGLPSVFAGMVIGIFLGWLLFVVLIRKKKNQKKI